MCVQVCKGVRTGVRIELRKEVFMQPDYRRSYDQIQDSKHHIF